MLTFSSGFDHVLHGRMVLLRPLVGLKATMITCTQSGELGNRRSCRLTLALCKPRYYLGSMAWGCQLPSQNGSMDQDMIDAAAAQALQLTSPCHADRFRERVACGGCNRQR